MDLGLITTKEVRTVLARFSSARTLGGSCLTEMSALRRLLRDESIGDSEEALEWALGALLFDTAHDRLCQLRDHVEPEGQISPAEERSLLEDDFNRSNVKLEAWSALYYRYLCPSLQLSAAELAAVALPDHRRRSGQRLFQRRVQHALNELTGLLRDKERAARIDVRREEVNVVLQVDSVDRSILRLLQPVGSGARTGSPSIPAVGESRVA